jgi:hypothetical protein
MWERCHQNVSSSWSLPSICRTLDGVNRLSSKARADYLSHTCSSRSWVPETSLPACETPGKGRSSALRYGTSEEIPFKKGAARFSNSIACPGKGYPL